MAHARADALLRQAAELEERDAQVASELASVEDLADGAARIRSRALGLAAEVERLPEELEAAIAAGDAADEESAHAGRALARAEEAQASLGRRASQDERDQVERELRRAREELHDAQVRAERARARQAELAAREHALGALADALLVEARAVATCIRASERVADAGKGDPGDTLASVEEWGARARAALFVARGTLATEREQIVLEANALGASVLGEELGGSSVSLVRRRLEQALTG